MGQYKFQKFCESQFTEAKELINDQKRLKAMCRTHSLLPAQALIIFNQVERERDNVERVRLGKVRLNGTEEVLEDVK